MIKQSGPQMHTENAGSKLFLTALADKLRPRLRKIQPLSLAREKTQKTSTGGFRIVLAKTRRMRVELWFDMYARYPNRHIWYGYYWGGKNKFDASFGHWHEYVGHECVRKDSDATDSKPYHFKRKPRTSEFGHPFLEQYRSSKEYFFGCFDLRTVVGNALVDDIARFVSRTIAQDETITVDHIFPRKAKDIEREEERRLVKALKYARQQGPATERKKRDRYVCQICKFDFSTAYPGLGSKFAEAHHIESLNRAKGARVRVTPDSFKTLCANCHRMVHRAETLLQGDPVDHVAHAFKRGQSLRRV